MTDATCASCGTVLPAAAVLYDEQGNVNCQRCLMAAQALDSQKTAALKVKRIAYGGPAIALVALVFNPFWLLTVAAVGNGIYVLRSVSNPETAKHLGDSFEKIKVAAIAGMILGVVTGIARLFLSSISGL
jgi:hypothetical protein